MARTALIKEVHGVVVEILDPSLSVNGKVYGEVRVLQQPGDRLHEHRTLYPMELAEFLKWVQQQLLAVRFPDACAGCGWVDPATADPCSVCNTPRPSSC